MNVIKSDNGSLSKKKRSSKSVTDKEHEQPVTKRQKRLKPNDKHAWPQQSKIASSEARVKAHIRVAGLDTNQKLPSTLSPSSLFDNTDQHEMKFGRLLGSTDQRQRHAAIRQLSNYLKARTDTTNSKAGGLSELDLLKLWKGIWFCFYMSDKVPVQQELSAQIASLLFSVAGTEEEDEYAGKCYIELFGDEDDDESESSEREEFDEEEDDEDYDDDDDDDDSANIEILDNDFSSEEEDDEDEEEDNIESESTGNSEEMEDTENRSIGDEEDDEDFDSSVVRHCRGAHLAGLFVRTFFATIRREWGNMDKYRVDKFYTLMRDMLHNIYEYMATRHWNLGVIRLFNDAIYEEVLNQTPNGLRYHLIDVALEEMAKVNDSDKAVIKLTEATFIDVFEPFFAMAQTGAGGLDSVQKRVAEHFLEKFLLEYSFVSENAIKKDMVPTDKSTNNKSDENDTLVFDNVHVKTIADFIFALGTDQETSDKYRKSLYDMHKLYIRKIKEAGRDVDKDGAEDDEESDENAPVTNNQIDAVGIHDIAKKDLADDEKKSAMNGSKSKIKKNRKNRNVNVVMEADEFDSPVKPNSSIEKRSKADSTENSDEKRTKKSTDRKKIKETDLDCCSDGNNDCCSDGNNVHIEVNKKGKKTANASDKFDSSDKHKSRGEKSSKADVSKNGADKRTEKSSEQVKISDASLEATANGNKKGKKSQKTPAVISENSEEKQSQNKVVNKMVDTIDSLDKSERKKKKKQLKSVASGAWNSSDDTVDKTMKNPVGQKDEKLNTLDVGCCSTPERSLNTKKEKDHSSPDERNRKKKGKDKASPHPKEETITISLQEQGLAKNFTKKNASKLGDKSSNNDDSKTSSGEKVSAKSPDGNRGNRVIFSEFNRARSYKASMKNLNNLKSPVSKSTPERSILRNKQKMHRELLSKNIDQNMNKNPNGKKRKKATDYF